MGKLLLHWLLSGLAIVIVSQIVPGFMVAGMGPALLAALAIGLLNATLGFVLKLVTFPLEILTLGLFWFVINAGIIELATQFIRGFAVQNFMAAFLGGLVLSFINMIFRMLTRERR